MILVIGIGGAAFPGGNPPIFGYALPSIATAAMVGILLNLVFTLPPPSRARGAGEVPPGSGLDIAETGA